MANEYPLKLILDCYDSGVLAVPDWQRDADAWDPKDIGKKSDLVGSVLYGLPIPPWGLFGTPWKGGIADGLQRTQVLSSFRKNEFRLRKFKVIPDDMVRRWGKDPLPYMENKRYSDLTEELRDTFDNYAITSQGFADEDQARVMFGRMNRAVLKLSEVELIRGEAPARVRDFLTKTGQHIGGYRGRDARRTLERRADDSSLAISVILGLLSEFGDYGKGYELGAGGIRVHQGGDWFDCLRRHLIAYLDNYSNAELENLENRVAQCVRGLHDVLGENYLSKVNGKNIKANNKLMFLRGHIFSYLRRDAQYWAQHKDDIRSKLELLEISPFNSAAELQNACSEARKLFNEWRQSMSA